MEKRRVIFLLAVISLLTSLFVVSVSAATLVTVEPGILEVSDISFSYDPDYEAYIGSIPISVEQMGVFFEGLSSNDLYFICPQLGIDGYFSPVDPGVYLLSESDSGIVSFVISSDPYSVFMLVVPDPGVVDLTIRSSPPAAAPDMESVSSDLLGTVSSLFDVISNVVDSIVSSPFLLLTVGFLFLGACVGIFGRVMS